MVGRVSHLRAQAAFASILIPGLPEPYRKRETKERCVLFLLRNRYPTHRESRNLKLLQQWQSGKYLSKKEDI